jgi:Winged helix-turn helix
MIFQTIPGSHFDTHSDRHPQLVANASRSAEQGLAVIVFDSEEAAQSFADFLKTAPDEGGVTLEAELNKGLRAHGFAGDQRWTLGRIKTLIRTLFHVGYTVEGTGKLMRRHGGRPRSPSGRRCDATRRRSRWGRPRCGRI